MLSDRQRKQLAAEMVECGEAMLDALRGPVGHTPDPASIAGALAKATEIVASMQSDFESPFGEHVATLDKAMRAAATSYYPTKVGTFDELADAVEDARLYVRGVKDRARTVSTYWGGGVRGIWEQRLARVYIDAEVGVLCDRFGVRPIAALFRLAAGANRVVSLLHLMQLNNQHHEDHDSVPYERNLNFAAMQLLGYLRELGVVVDDLRRPGSTSASQALLRGSLWQQSEPDGERQ